ncbi:uncharacterized protein LOC143148460 [Ptiloglossa arizonensis]|uniref:uncharacterized protein LOC143148460 n=1 Tax=Ptiloglossa arizonensis TaxID=3350558 RepID=UPI003F9FEB72
MYGRQGGDQSGNAQPPPWLVRAEVTIRHSSPTTPESGQTPLGVTSTVTDSDGVRMTYRWNTSQPTSTTIPVSSTYVAPTSSNSFGFQRGNILFTSTPPPRPSLGSFTIPRSSSSGNEESTSSRGRTANVSDSGYNSEQFSARSYSSLPSRRPSQQYNRRCKSTCSIVLSAVDTTDKKDTTTTTTTTTSSVGRAASNESTKHSYDHSWRHHSSHQHVFSRHQFTTVPEVCEEGTEESTSSVQFRDKVTGKSTTISKDASSQTTDIESRESSSTVFTKSRCRRKAVAGLHCLDEQKKKKQESQSPSVSETTSIGQSAESEKSDTSTTKDDGKRKSRTVHIDVYCTGTEEDDDDENTSSENECDTPLTVFENPDVKVTHTQILGDVLPRGFQDDKAFLTRATERRCDSFKHAPMRMPSLTSSKGYDSDDVLSSLYPSQFSSYSALRDLDSAPLSAASSNAGIPFDYDSVATSSKDTFSDIDSLISARPALTPCDSFEYASFSDRERIRRMGEIWAKSDTEGNKSWRSPQIERGYLLRNRKMRDYLEKREMGGWSSAESGEDTDESGTVGWSFVSSEESQRMIKKTSTIRRSSKNVTETANKNATTDVKENEPPRKNTQTDRSDSTSKSEHVIPHQQHTLRDQIGPFGSNSPSPLLSKVPSRVTSPFMTPQGERTDHIVKASIFGRVVNAFRKPGHHIGPAKNPSCSCEHCRRHFEELNSRERSRSISEFERQTGFRLQNERKIVRSYPKNCKS